MFFEQKFVLYRDDGQVFFVDDLVGFISNFGGSAKFIDHMKFNVGEYKKARKQIGYISQTWWVGETAKFFVCTEDGMMISPDLLYGEYSKYWYDAWGKRIEKRELQRRHIRGNNKRHTYTTYKRMGTHPARRAAAGVVTEDGEPEFRGKRGLHSISTFWDDIKVRRSCSWKNTKRKKQYKGS